MRLVLFAVGTIACGKPDLQVTWPAGSEGSRSVLVTPNLDDDDADGAADWTQRAPVPDDADRALVSFANKKRPTTLRIDGDADRVRVWYGGAVVAGEGSGTTWALPDRARDETIDVQIEVGGWGAVATLVLIDDKREVEEEVRLIGTQPTLGHHLLPTRDVWVVGVDDGGLWNNDALLAALDEHLGEVAHRIDGSAFDYDVWIQDEPEFTAMWSPESESVLIVDSIRDGLGGGGLDPFPESIAGGPVFVKTFGQPDLANTYDSFGNLEVSPPVEVDGVPYPLGRAYFGWDGGAAGPHGDLRRFLDEAGVQQPFWVDTSWLCVGHIDEVTTFVPDPTAPRGFRFLIADTSLGAAAIRSVPAETRLVNHGRRGFNGHGRPTAASYQEDVALFAYNEDVQARHLEPMLGRFRAELALTDDEIVRVPAFFEEVSDDFGVCGALAIIPGTVNMLVATDAEGTGGKVFLPDPFFRPNEADRSADPFVRAWEELLPKDLERVWVDDWFVYHMGYGEIHCGTNQTRDPALSKVDLDTWLSEVAP